MNVPTIHGEDLNLFFFVINIFKTKILAEIFLTGRMTFLNVAEVKYNFSRNNGGSPIKKLGSPASIDKNWLRTSAEQ